MCGSVNAEVPPTPALLANTTGNFWVNHTWEAGGGHPTDSYNVSVNSIWYNTSPAYYNDTYSQRAWQNITVYAYSEVGDGNLSTGYVTQNTQVPNGLGINLVSIIAILNQIPDILDPIPDILAAMAVVAIYGGIIVLAVGIVYKLRDTIGKMLQLGKGK